VGDFEEFFAEHYARVVRSLVLALGHTAEAEDAAQDAFTRALRRWSAVSAMARPGTWVYVVAVRQLRRRLGRGGRSRNLEGGSSATSVGDPAVILVTADWIEGALDGLPARQRLAIVLRFYADLSVADIARAMRCSQGTVKSTLHAALSRLRVDLADEVLEGSDGW
jgi:RNA polymerase sigma-70 factor (ECF subfamily)